MNKISFLYVCFRNDIAFIFPNAIHCSVDSSWQSNWQWLEQYRRGWVHKWCFPWLSLADGGATEESLRRQRTVNPRNCGLTLHPPETRRSGIENYILPRNIRHTPTTFHLWISQQIHPQPSHRLDAFVIGYIRDTHCRIHIGHFLQYQRYSTRALPGCFQSSLARFIKSATENRIEIWTKTIQTQMGVFLNTSVLKLPPLGHF